MSGQSPAKVARQWPDEMVAPIIMALSRANRADVPRLPHPTQKGLFRRLGVLASSAGPAPVGPGSWTDGHSVTERVPASSKKQRHQRGQESRVEIREPKSSAGCQMLDAGR